MGWVPAEFLFFLHKRWPWSPEDPGSDPDPDPDLSSRLKPKVDLTSLLEAKVAPRVRIQRSIEFNPESFAIAVATPSV